MNVDQVSGFVSPRMCHNLPMPCVKDGEECVDGKGVMDAMAVFRSKETAEMLRDSEGSFELLKVGFGPAVEMIWRNVVGGTARKEGGEGVVFRLYSGHDTTLMPLLAVLDSLDLRWPPYVSSPFSCLHTAVKVMLSSQQVKFSFVHPNNTLFFRHHLQ